MSVNEVILKKVSIDQIKVGERFRKVYKNIDTLKLSLINDGQISPIALGLNPEKGNEKPYLLAAGGRRIKALVELSEERDEFKTVDAKIYNRVLNSLEYRSIELAENIVRDDLTYAEEVKLKAEVQSLQTEIHGVKISKRSGAKGWSQAETAKMLGVSPASMTRDLRLAQAIESLPDLKLDECKNKSEAFKKLNKLDDMLTAKKLAERYQRSIKDGDELAKRLSNSYITGDFFELVKSVPDETVDLCEVDPPYAIKIDNAERRKRGFKANYSKNSYNEVDVKDYIPFIKNTLKECYRALKDGGWLVLWFGPEPWHHIIYELLRATGFDTHRLCGIWYKETGQTNSPFVRMANTYEMFYYARKGQSKLNKKGRSNVFHFTPVHYDKKIHPTERPLSLMKEILKTFVRENSNVLVPFLGSGKTLIAAHKCNMSAYGYELSPDYKDLFLVSLQNHLDGVG